MKWKKSYSLRAFSIHNRGPIFIAGVYLVIGALWILFSDQIAASIAPDQATLTKISTYKGWGYVLVTALLLYLLIRSHTSSLLKSEKQLRLWADAFEGCAHGIAIHDPRTNRILDCNSAFAKMHDMPARELIGASAPDLFVESDHDKVLQQLAQADRLGRVSFEANKTRRDESVFNAQMDVVSVRDEDGNIRYRVSTAQDITDRKVSNDALARSEKRYRSLFENMTNGFARCQMVYDPEGKPIDFIYLDVNNAFRKLPGFQDVVGKRITDLIPGIRETNPELFEIYGRVASTGEPEHFESYLPGLGTGIWFSVSAYCPEKGFFISLFEIITERKQAELQLQESEQRYRELVQNANSAILRWKSDGTISFFNEYAQKFFGYTSEEIIGRDVNILVPRTESTGGDLSELVKSIVEHPELFENVINENICSDGRRVWMTWTNQPVYDENRNVIEILAIGSDITERKRAEELLQRNHKQLLSFIEQAPISIAMFDREMNYLSVSNRWVMEFGRGYTELIGLNHYDVHPDIPEEWKAAHRKGQAGESLRNDDDIWTQSDGTKFWLRWAITPWTDENGGIGGIIISAEDISERKRAEAAAFQNEVRYHRVLDAMMEGCQIIDFDWRYVYVNDVVAQQGKHKPEELLGKTMMEMYPGIEKTELFDVLQKCMADREPRRMENRFVFPDGSVGWFELSIQPAQEGLFILSTDITERVEALQTISDLAKFPEENPNPVLRVDVDGHIIYANPGSQILLNNWKADVGGLLPKTLCALTREIYPKGTKHITDIPVRDYIFEVVFTPITDAGYINIYGHDVTERRSMEQKLQLENERFLRFVDSNIVGIVIADAGGRISLANDYYLKLLGVTRQDFEDGKVDWRKFTPPEWLPVDEEAIRELQEHGICDPYEKEYIRTDGERVVVYIANAMLPGPGQQIAAFVLDITERKQAEAEILRLNDELEQRVIERTSQLDAANKELEAFAYSVSHDLRAPLRAIDGFTQILMEDYEPLLGGEGKRVCGVISRETVRMGQLIDDLLSFSRLSRADMHTMPVDMKELANSVFLDLAGNEDMGRVDFSLGELPVADGDARLLRQVWINLLSNALKFSSRKKRALIEVGGTQGRDENVYYVRDNGAGFDMEYVDRLFGVFQRLHGENEFEGTGVGLAIVQRVVHRHGGRVWAEGKVGEGAVFHFTIPKKGP